MDNFLFREIVRTGMTIMLLMAVIIFAGCAKDVSAPLPIVHTPEPIVPLADCVPTTHKTQATVPHTTGDNTPLEREVTAHLASLDVLDENLGRTVTCYCGTILPLTSPEWKKADTICKAEPPKTSSKPEKK